MAVITNRPDVCSFIVLDYIVHSVLIVVVRQHFVGKSGNFRDSIFFVSISKKNERKV